MMQVKYGDQPVYSQAFTHSLQTTHPTQHSDSEACSSAAALMSFQMPPAIRPFDPNHWLCGSSPLPCSNSRSGYQPVKDGPELNYQPTRRSVQICLLHSAAHTNHMLIALSCALAPSARMCSGSLLWPAQQACAGLPSPTARSKLPRTTALPAALRQLCAFLQAFQLLPLYLWHWLPVQEERQGRLSEFGLLLSSLLGAVVSLHIEMPLCPAFAAQGPPSSVARGPLCYLLLPNSGAQACT